MKNIYVNKIEEEQLKDFLPDVNMSDRDKEIVRKYLEGDITKVKLSDEYGVSRERIRQIIEKFARKAHHIYIKQGA